MATDAAQKDAAAKAAAQQEEQTIKDAAPALEQAAATKAAAVEKAASVRATAVEKAATAKATALAKIDPPERQSSDSWEKYGPRPVYWSDKELAVLRQRHEAEAAEEDALQKAAAAEAAAVQKAEAVQAEAARCALSRYYSDAPHKTALLKKAKDAIKAIEEKVEENKEAAQRAQVLDRAVNVLGKLQVSPLAEKKGRI